MPLTWGYLSQTGPDLLLSFLVSDLYLLSLYLHFPYASLECLKNVEYIIHIEECLKLLV